MMDETTLAIFTHIVVFSIAYVLAGSLRVQKGMNQNDRVFKIPTAVLFVLYTAVGVGALFITAGISSYYWTIPLALVASLNLWMGPSKWIDEGWESYKMVFRYLTPMTIPLLAIVVFNLTLPVQTAVYCLILILAGASYPILSEQKVITFLESRYPDIHTTRIAEFISGGCVIGGLGLL